MKEKSSLPKRSEANDFLTVSSWTHQELARLQKTSKLPICIELQNGDYNVGSFKVTKVSASCWKVENIEFFSKRSAIFFCALSHVKNYSLANELRDADWMVGKLDMDKGSYRIRLDAAHETNDQFKIDLYSSRFDDAKRKLTIAKQELEKIFSRAKYLYKTF